MKAVRVLGSEIVLGSLIAVLSVLTAISGFQGNMADSEQNKNEVFAQKMLTDANAEYLTANQMIVYDYSMYDGWYTADTADKEEYYLANFSAELQADIDQGEAFSEAYYEAMYAFPNSMFDDADAYFDVAEQYDNHGDSLQLVMLIMALGLTFAAWASLLKEESNMRVLFAIFSIAMLIYGLVTYLTIPAIIV